MIMTKKEHLQLTTAILHMLSVSYNGNTLIPRNSVIDLLSVFVDEESNLSAEGTEQSVEL
jgi:hypothetical protein